MATAKPLLPFPLMIAADELPFKVGGKDFGGWD
jgi:hypothetical protein